MAKLGCCSSSGSVNDSVCTTVTVDGVTPIPIWENTTNFIVNGTILVENNGLGAAWDADLIINGLPTAALTVPPGESNSITVNNLMSIDIQGSGAGTVNTPVKVSFSLNYNF